MIVDSVPICNSGHAALAVEAHVQELMVVGRRIAKSIRIRSRLNIKWLCEVSGLDFAVSDAESWSIREPWGDPPRY